MLMCDAIGLLKYMLNAQICTIILNYEVILKAQGLSERQLSGQTGERASIGEVEQTKQVNKYIDRRVDQQTSVKLVGL